MIEQIKENASELKKVYFYSILDCFTAHNGFRNGEIHTLVGSRGSGKSTLSKTVILDLLTQNKKVFLWLSEEMPEKYLVPIYEMLVRKYKTEEKIKDVLSNLKIITELDLDENYKKNFIKALEYDLDDFGAEFILYDNYTTGIFSSMQYEKQTKLLSLLREIMAKRNIPIFMIFHSDKKTNQNLKPMTSEDVKGFSRPVDIGSYNYLLKQVNVADLRVNFLIVDKSRYHARAQKTVWELKYKPELGIFEKSIPVTMTDFLSVFKKVKEK